MKKEMFNKVEVGYGDYKNNYMHCTKGEYNAETKKIEIYILKDEYLTEAALKLEKELHKINALEITPQEKMKKASQYLAYNLSAEYHTSSQLIRERLRKITSDKK